ncbi:MAG TPA: bifunctional 5,10-methylenetetrahydrofolate dehydrogenase/5,10-methenyltetrahydrofolate cyclohydrolase [Phnomibacter sp.]|nr:bifunctional 5,10-methylenetetrahydrofolate dehydrogenase/5,10-methenyltetrahydrofolate cyclohydrolase [Phnomibacter sp.]
MQILDGKVAAAAIKEKLKHAVEQRKQEGKKVPHLAVIIVGNDGASETYVGSKVRTSEEIGFGSTLVRLDADIPEALLLGQIREFNENADIDGILVQLPLPPHISEAKVIEAIHPDKDVDGFHPQSAGRLVQGLDTFIPATPYGIMLMLEYYGISTTGKHAVVIGRSNIVGRPMSILLSSQHAFGNCTVTVCHSKTKDLGGFTRQADIVVAALGRPGFLKADMVKEGAVIIDVGITRVPDATKKKGFAIKGDVDFDEVAPKTEWITPVPGGVGLMTIGALMMNTLKACARKDH